MLLSAYESDSPIKFTNDGDKTKNGSISISFINARKNEDGYGYLSCLIVWCRGGHYYIEEDGLKIEAKTWYEILEKGKAWLFDLIDAPAAAINRINLSVDEKVLAFKHKMDVRIAEFRGLLFDQVCQLKEVSNG